MCWILHSDVVKIQDTLYLYYMVPVQGSYRSTPEYWSTPEYSEYQVQVLGVLFIHCDARLR